MQDEFQNYGQKPLLGLPVYRKKDRFEILAPSEPHKIYKTGSTYGALMDIFICCSINRRLLTEQIIFKKMCTHGRYKSATQVKPHSSYIVRYKIVLITQKQKTA